MARLNLVSGRGAWSLSVVVLLVGIGCSNGDSDGNGGSAGSGSGGTAGAGGEGGAGVVTRSAMETCQTWCRNEANGPSCCFEVQLPPPFDDFFAENDCRGDCYDLCEETVAEMACLEEYVAVRECQIQLACDDFFDECQALDGRLVGCSLRADAEASGLCAVAAAACSITEAECLSTFVEAGSPDCAFGWEEYVFCLEDGFFTCEECVDFTQPSDQECNWPSGAGEDIPFVPQSCDTFQLPPAGCDGPCLGGSDTECGIGTYCEAEVCEANCITNADCARGDACSVRGRCLPTIFGNPLECSFFDDPPSGCGESCPSGSTSECPGGTFCTSQICDAECGSVEDCGAGAQCSDIGRCVLSECSDGRSLDETFTSDRAPLACDIMGIGINFEGVLTAKPTAPLQSGSNTYDVQLAFGIDVDTVNLLINLTNEMTFTEITGTVAPTMGTTAPSSVAFQNTPLPCAESLIQDIPVEIILPVGQATWNLDDGTTQELTFEDIDVTLSAAGLDIPLMTGPGGTCIWDVSPPTVAFSLP